MIVITLSPAFTPKMLQIQMSFFSDILSNGGEHEIPIFIWRELSQSNLKCNSVWNLKSNSKANNFESD